MVTHPHLFQYLLHMFGIDVAVFLGAVPEYQTGFGSFLVAFLLRDDGIRQGSDSLSGDGIAHSQVVRHQQNAHRRQQQKADKGEGKTPKHMNHVVSSFRLSASQKAKVALP